MRRKVERVEAEKNALQAQKNVLLTERKGLQALLGGQELEMAALRQQSDLLSKQVARLEAQLEEVAMAPARPSVEHGSQPSP